MIKFLQSGTKDSLMRLSVISMVWTSCLYVIIVTLFNIYYNFNSLPLITIDWVGVTSFGTVALLGKVAQHYTETKTQNNDN